MTEDGKNRMIWGALLLAGALGGVLLRNHLMLGFSPFAIGLMDGVLFVCIMAAVRVSDWRMATAIALATPVLLWMQRFLDGYMIPVDMAVNLTLIGCMLLAMKHRNYWINVILLVLPAYAVLLMGGTMAIWIVKNENLIRSLIIAWNTDVYAGLSIVGAALICAPHVKKENSIT